MIDQDFFNYRDTCLICDEQLNMIAVFTLLFIDRHINDIGMGCDIIYKYNKASNKFIKYDIVNIFDTGDNVVENIFNTISQTFTLSDKNFPKIGINKIRQSIEPPFQLLLPEFTLERYCTMSDHKYAYGSETFMHASNDITVFIEELCVLEHKISNSYYDNTTHITIPDEQINFNIPMKHMKSWNFNKQSFNKQINKYMMLA